ncbi:lytic transglycosylase domain-containing protein [Burkholderia multivorans]|uniref:transglycosylase SLT domain-containing protein n=1 Tax=Burkholderia multivorans TaxID=87883 RepID=UPI001C224434|nr:lytic transglycosylase domain-containing protein [Burkholderia multivorans]
MADYSNLFQKAGAKYGVPPQLLSAIQRVESGSGDNPAVVGPQPAIGGSDRAQGIMQIMSANAKAAGIDPNNPEQAVDWAAEYLARMRAKYGNLDDAVRAYHGGTNTKNWGPRTQNYYQKVSARLQPQQGQAMPQTQMQTNTNGLIDPFADAAPSPTAAPSAAVQAQPAQQQLIDPFADAAPGPLPNEQKPEPENAPGKLASFGAGLGHGLGSTVLGAQQLLGKGLQAVGADTVGNWLVNDATQGAKKLDAEYAPYQQANPMTAGAGNIGGQVVPALALPGGQAAIARLGNAAARIGARAAVGAAQGAAMGAVQPVANPDQDFAQQKLQQVQEGATGGALGAPIGAAVGRVLSPVGNAAARALQAADIRPTLGQMLGPTASQFEQKAMSIPLVGDLIRSGRTRAVQDYNRAIANDALAPIGQTLPKNIQAGPAAIQHVQKAIGDKYDDIARNGRVVMDDALQKDLVALQQGISQDAPGLAGRFSNIIQNQLLGKNGGTLSGDQWANTRSMINRQIANHSGPTASSDDRVMAEYLQNLQDAITANAEHYSNNSVRQGLAKANAAWARYKAMENAAGKPSAQRLGNIFTPEQYMAAASAGQSAAQKATSSGPAAYPAQQLSQAVQPLLGATVPDSGTAGRAALNAAIGTGGFLSNPVTALKAATVSVPYLPYVRDAVPALMTSRPAAVRAAAPVARRLGPLVGGMLGSQQQQQDQGALSGLLSY